MSTPPVTGTSPTWHALAPRFAAVGLSNICTEYPHKLDHLANSAGEIRTPKSLHPVFYGSYDWHSCVHMHWMLCRLLRACPELEQGSEIRARFDQHFTPANVERELDYLQQPGRSSFERTYGWAWLLKLQHELVLAEADFDDPKFASWREAVQPLADEFVQRYLNFLPRTEFAIRAGTHANSAFGLLFAYEYAQQIHHSGLATLIRDKAQAWFGSDCNYPIAYEPGGDDFLSGGLMEASLMATLLSPAEFAQWWAQFMPDTKSLLAWQYPVQVSDRADPKLSHLDGLNLSRAWCWRRLRNALPSEQHATIDQAMTRLLTASLPHAAHGDYVGTHWLASFALLALGA